MPDAYRDQKASEHQRPDLQMIVSHHVTTWEQNLVFCQNHGLIFAAPCHPILSVAFGFGKMVSAQHIFLLNSQQSEHPNPGSFPFEKCKKQLF